MEWPITSLLGRTWVRVCCVSSKGAIKWLARLGQPRTIESLILEVYGEATWYGCLFEREVADLLSFYELSKSLREFNNDDWTLNQLIKEVEKRQFLPEEHLSILRDAKSARNELVHRLIAKKLIFSRTDKEMLLAEIDALYLRIWGGYQLVSWHKKHFASVMGIADEAIKRTATRLHAEAKIADENVRKLIGNEPQDA